MQPNFEESYNSNFDVEDLYNFFLRNRISIGLVTVFFLITSLVFGYTRKEVWEGQFGIVLDRDNKKNTSLSNLLSAGPDILSNLNSTSTSLKTQVGILNSSSILMPIFDEFIKPKEGDISKNNQGITFKEWKKRSLSINLKKSTSILQISYKDIDKERILPVLNRMTEIYQRYSGKSKKRSTELTKRFLTKQIDLYKEKSSSSLKKAQEYAMDQNLDDILNFPISNLEYTQNDEFGVDNFIKRKRNKEESNESKVYKTLNIEEVRIKAANKIKNIDLQIEKIQNIKDNYVELEYIGSTIPILVEEGLQEALQNIEEKIMRQRVKFKDNDKSITRLLIEREMLAKLIQNRAIGILKAQRLMAEATKEAASRPKGVLLKYKELVREAARDENTLINLENQLRITSIEEARIQDPWELITNPTIDSDPVGPKKLRIAGIGTLLGLILGCMLVFYKEQKSNKIFTYKALQYYLGTKFKSNLDDGKSGILFIESLLKSNPEKEIKLLKLGNINDSRIKLLEHFNENKRLKIQGDLESFEKNEIIILAVSLNSLYIDEVNNIENIINLYELNLKGIIII